MIYETGLTEGNLVDGMFQPTHYYPDPGSGISGYLRYPGAVFRDPNGPIHVTPPTSGFLVRIPVVSVPAYSASATESIVNWVYPLEPILDGSQSRRFFRECGHVVRSKRHRVAADQLSLSIGEHERFSAAG